MTFKELSFAQKGLLITLYALIILMVIFSINAIKNIGPESYDKCNEESCAGFGEHCGKPRTMMTCCAGAGGALGTIDNKYVCRFLEDYKGRATVKAIIVPLLFLSIGLFVYLGERKVEEKRLEEEKKEVEENEDNKPNTNRAS